MRIAIIGSGIAGLVCGYVLGRSHQVVLYEADDYAGGHSHTVSVARREGRALPIDTGFIVYNERNYPQFTTLLRQLGVATQPTTMGFSVNCARTGIEYCGSTLDKIFGQRLNLVRPGFLRMCTQILRFNREAPKLLAQSDASLTLGQFLEQGRYSQEFRELYLYPMGAALWSAPPGEISQMPALFFARFFQQHGMLSLDERPEWRTVSGGAIAYVAALCKNWRVALRLNCPVASVRRLPAWVEVQPASGEAERFDEVIIATHSDQALGLLADASPAEVAILGALPYQENEVVLHTDISVLPQRKSLWAAWNYHVPKDPAARATVTYHMNLLQNLPGPTQYLISLNETKRIDPAKIIQTFSYAHPQFTAASVAAQARRNEISGFNRTHYCGAYWGNGFHEDGVASALVICRKFNWDLNGRLDKGSTSSSTAMAAAKAARAAGETPG